MRASGDDVGCDTDRQSGSIQLGFCIPIESEKQRQLVGHRTFHWKDWDGGQAGGRPTWLDPSSVPSSPPTCRCTNTMRFICQIYAPRDEDSYNFHRTLYLWGCDVCNQVVVWRSQLPEQNPYWKISADNDIDERDPPTKMWCATCGFPSKGLCPKQKLPFCGPQHQRHYLKRKSNGVLYKEHEIVVEEEDIGCQASADDPLFDPAVVHDDPDSDVELEQGDLDEMLRGKSGKPKLVHPEDNAAWESFQERIRGARDQVLRYGGTHPLWVLAAPPNLNIPMCEACGAERTYEFQLMPQFLQYLTEESSSPPTTPNDGDSTVTAIAAAEKLIQEAPPELVPPELVDQKERAINRIENNGLDWGTVAIYTCSKSCEISSYVTEFAITQPAFPSDAD